VIVDGAVATSAGLTDAAQSCAAAGEAAPVTMASAAPAAARVARACNRRRAGRPG